MKKIFDWFFKWDKDKILHVLLSLVISMAAAVVAKWLGCDKFDILWVAWSVGFLSGFAKEVYDEKFSDGSDSGDWCADLIGTTIGTITAFVLVV